MAFDHNDPKFIGLIKEHENNKGDNSYDKKTNAWHKYPDAHGFSIGYGHFITREEAKRGHIEVEGVKYPIAKGIPDAVAERLLAIDVAKHMKIAERQFNQLKPGGLEWHQVPDITQAALGFVTYNVGGITSKDSTGKTVLGWPKLVIATLQGDDSQFVTQLNRKGPRMSRIRAEADYLVDYMKRPLKQKTTPSIREWAGLVGAKDAKLYPQGTPLPGVGGVKDNDVAAAAGAYRAGIQSANLMVQIRKTEAEIAKLKAAGATVPEPVAPTKEEAKAKEQAPTKLGPGTYMKADGTIFEINLDGTAGKELFSGNTAKAL